MDLAGPPPKERNHHRAAQVDHRYLPRQAPLVDLRNELSVAAVAACSSYCLRTLRREAAGCALLREGSWKSPRNGEPIERAPQLATRSGSRSIITIET